MKSEFGVDLMNTIAEDIAYYNKLYGGRLRVERCKNDILSEFVYLWNGDIYITLGTPNEINKAIKALIAAKEYEF